jgi:adenylate cyclase
MPSSSPAGGRLPRLQRAAGALSAALRRLDGHARALDLVQRGRGRLPGDDRYGDPLSLTGTQAPDVLARRLTTLMDERPSVLRELGFGVLQVWQGLSEAQGRGQGDREVAIVFTDLVDFSEWVLDAGDTNALELLRQVGLAVEQPVKAHGGRVVKRLGDGMMAVFEDPAAAVQAACEASSGVEDVKVNGYEPRLRAGVHVGRPRKLGGDYFGVDVNVAARVAAAAGGGEVLISSTVRERLDPEEVSTRRRRRFKQKGTPKGLQAFVAQPAG